MELIKISNTKLKIILTDADLAHYHISTETFDYADSGDRRAFWALLDDARQSTGFETGHTGLEVQLYPSRSGGCEIFITKTQPNVKGAECLTPRAGFSENAMIRLRPGYGYAGDGKGATAYSFDSVDCLLRVCTILHRNGHEGRSSAYRGDDGCYYLILFDTLTSLLPEPDSTTFLCEFGKKENADALLLYIREHGGVICESNAVEILGTIEASASKSQFEKR